MKFATTLVTLLLTLTRGWGAASALDGEVFLAAGTSGTNALPSSRTTNTTALIQSTAPATTVALKLNTATTHTSGDLIQAQNNSTNTFTVAAVNGYTSQGVNLLSDNGKYRWELGPLIVSNIIVAITNLGAVTTNLYTVPPGYRAVFGVNVITTNASAGTSQVKIQIGGTYFAFTTAGSNPTTAMGQLAQSSPFIMEAGDILAVTTSTVGVTVIAGVSLFSTNSYFKSPRKVLSSGDNTVYTVPSGYQALPVLSFLTTSGQQQINETATQLSGGPLLITRTLNGIPRIGTSTVTSGTPLNNAVPPLGPGDVLACNTPSADTTQLMYLTILEVPVPLP